MKAIFLLLSLSCLYCCYAQPYNSERDKLLSYFQTAGENADEEQLVACINYFKQHCKKDSIVVKAILSKLQDNNAIYKNRNSATVTKLRAYLLASLDQIGVIDEALPVITRELTYGYHPNLIGAAARAAKHFGNNAGKIVPLFAGFISPSFHDDNFDLDNYNYQWPLAQPTSATEEILKTLSEFSISEVSVLEKNFNLLQANKNIRLSALSTKILDSLSREITSLPPCCCKKSLVNEQRNYAPVQWKSIWAQERSQPSIFNVTASDEQGTDLNFNKLIGKPFALCFFYTRCDNPNKCSFTILQLARLQQLTYEKGMKNKVGFYACTYDPEFDNAVALKNYGADRQFDFNSNSRFLRFNSNDLATVTNALKVAVNYDHDIVNTHGVQLYLFDKKGKIAYLVQDEKWNEQLILNILQKLSKE